MEVPSYKLWAINKYIAWIKKKQNKNKQTSLGFFKT